MLFGKREVSVMGIEEEQERERDKERERVK